MTDAYSSFGTLLKVGDGEASPSFTTIAEVQDIGGPSFELGTEEVTHHQSPGGWREKIGTLLDGGEITFDVNFLPGNATQDHESGLVYLMVNKLTRNFRLYFADADDTVWNCPALVTGVEPNNPVEGKADASITLTVNGQPEFNPT